MGEGEHQSARRQVEVTATVPSGLVEGPGKRERWFRRQPVGGGACGVNLQPRARPLAGAPPARPGTRL
jgi:hypothetical protein